MASVVIRARKGVPGVGRKIARSMGANEVTAGYYPKKKIPDNALVINYGRSALPVWESDATQRGARILNHPCAVGLSANKIATLQALSSAGVRALEHTTSPQVAKEWLEEEGAVIVRETVSGKGGKGVVLYDGPVDDLPSAPLYTKYIKKTHEIRVHVAGGEVIDYVQKKRMGSKKLEQRGLDKADELIRNHKRGWVFARKDILDTPTIRKMGVDAINAIGLDFGAADILCVADEEGNLVDAFVCETNSAPGMSGATTFNAYINYFKAEEEKQ